MSYVRNQGSMIICSMCGKAFHKSPFVDGTFPTDCSTCRGVDVNPEIKTVVYEPPKEEQPD